MYWSMQIRNIWARGGTVTVSEQSTSSNIAECEIGRFAFFVLMMLFLYVSPSMK